MTYFAFLSFFPILALAFFVVGYIARVYPDAQSRPRRRHRQVFPGMIGTGQGQISLSQSIEQAAATVGIIGLAGTDLRRPGLAVGDADRAPGGLRAPARAAAQLRRRQAARPADPGRRRDHPA